MPVPENKTAWRHVGKPDLDAKHHPYPVLLLADPKKCSVCGNIIEKIT